jgi:site-specific recombinase XerD
MKTLPSFASHLENFFTQRLMKQRLASPNTIKSYRDSFCLLLQFAQQRLNKQPSQLEITDVDAPLISSFLDEMEERRGISVRSRNVRLAAIRSFFRFAAFEAPAQSAQIQRVLAIPSKRHNKHLVTFLTQAEVKALVDAPDRCTWSGRRDHAFLLVASQTGCRSSEMTALKRQDVVLEAGPHVRVIGKGRKERCTPLTKQAVSVLKAWMNEPAKGATEVLFPNARGKRLSADGVNYILSKHLKVACIACPSLQERRVTPHSLRHGCAMGLLLAGVDRAMIALWLGHETVETTQMYLHANLKLKEEMLAKTMLSAGETGCYRADDELLAFLRGL